MTPYDIIFDIEASKAGKINTDWEWKWLRRTRSGLFEEGRYQDGKIYINQDIKEKGDLKRFTRALRHELCHAQGGGEIRAWACEFIPVLLYMNIRSKP